MKTKTHIAPSKASFDQICRIRRDNTNSGEYSLYTDGHTVGIYGSTGPSIDVPRKTFNRLLRWYLKPSKFIRK